MANEVEKAEKTRLEKDAKQIYGNLAALQSILDAKTKQLADLNARIQAAQVLLDNFKKL